jgi:hypothetical protein
LAVRTFTVADQAPAARIVGPRELMVGAVGRFSALDSGSVADPIVGYFWDTDFTGVFVPRAGNPILQKSWDKPGVYRIGLRVKDGDGSTTDAVHEVTVVAPKETPAAKPPVGAKQKTGGGK